MTDVVISVDDAQVQQLLDRIARRAQNATPAMGDIANELLAGIDEAFATESDPETGKPWVALSAGRIRQRSRPRTKKNPDGGTWPGEGILRVSGGLFSSMQSDFGADFAEVGTNQPYAATDHYGDDRRNIPARPFMGVSDDTLDGIREILADFLAGD